jgi:hypothetical protein
MTIGGIECCGLLIINYMLVSKFSLEESVEFVTLTNS